MIAFIVCLVTVGLLLAAALVNIRSTVLLRKQAARNRAHIERILHRMEERKHVE